ncbi:lasso peptide biosynthesis PqqD family chaperone [Psychrobacillus sp. NPDC096426]|uniref:lasso peptide biosynthesis PqqD family chaperone n=1 Tax=Psychrobacillus sp. NPDC096426 TaxID=3364491 RepID=UPI0037F4217C
MLQEFKSDLDQYVTQVEGNIISNMDGETVMLSIKNGKYYNLGVIGGYIWECVQEPVSLKNLIKSIQVEYDVTEEKCKTDLLPFIEKLRNEGLIKIY